VPGTTGYMLYCAPFLSQTSVSNLDAGSLNTLSGELEVGTSLSVAVQLYNAEGAIDVFSNAGILTIE
jgi:hypothetical protein